MRTIYFGIPLLAIGVLAALPFRRVPDAAPESLTPEHSFPLEMSAMVELPASPQHTWVPSPADVSPTTLPSTTFPTLPEEYEQVAVPLATPPAIAERFSAVQPEQFSPSPSDLSPDASAMARGPQPPSAWQMGLPIEMSPLPNDRPYGPQLDALAAAPSPANRTTEGDERGTPANPVGFAKTDERQPQTPMDSPAEFAPAGNAAATAAPRKRYFIREPVR